MARPKQVWWVRLPHLALPDSHGVLQQQICGHPSRGLAISPRRRLDEQESGGCGVAQACLLVYLSMSCCHIDSPARWCRRVCPTCTLIFGGGWSFSPVHASGNSDMATPCAKGCSSHFQARCCKRALSGRLCGSSLFRANKLTSMA